MTFQQYADYFADNPLDFHDLYRNEFGKYSGWTVEQGVDLIDALRTQLALPVHDDSNVILELFRMHDEKQPGHLLVYLNRVHVLPAHKKPRQPRFTRRMRANMDWPKHHGGDEHNMPHVTIRPATTDEERLASSFRAKVAITSNL